MNRDATQEGPLRVSFGPAMPGWGSWDWLGADTAAELGRYFPTSTFLWGELPDCDVAVVIKHLLPPAALVRIADRAAIVYCPVRHERVLPAAVARMRRHRVYEEQHRRDSRVAVERGSACLQRVGGGRRTVRVSQV